MFTKFKVICVFSSRATEGAQGFCMKSYTDNSRGASLECECAHRVSESQLECKKNCADHICMASLQCDCACVLSEH